MLRFLCSISAYRKLTDPETPMTCDETCDETCEKYASSTSSSAQGHSSAQLLELPQLQLTPTK